MNDILLTIFTPTYNRKKLLERTYNSLKNQTSFNFKWLIIDDGSTDDTESIVNQWIENEKRFLIKYIYKENGGLHTAYNKAIEDITTELCVCIDSDDYMPNNAVSLILDFWFKYGSNDYAGIIGLDYNTKDEVIGGLLPNVKFVYLMDLLLKYKKTGDSKVVYRSSLLKEVAPQPTFNCEKHFNPIYMMYQIDKKYPLLVLNENLCYVDYQSDGMASNIFKQYVMSPNSFAELRKLNMTMPRSTFLYKFKQCIHYVSSCLIAKRKNIIQDSPKRFLTLLCFPLGFIFSIYVKKKVE